MEKEFLKLRKSLSFSPSHPLVLAEIGQAHEGSFNVAQSLVEMAVDAGADGIKCQIHIPEHESTLDEMFRAGVTSRDKSRYAYWQRTALSAEEWADLRQLARENGILFIPSVCSSKAIDIVAAMNVDGWKIGSAEALQPWFVDSILGLDMPTIVSTGIAYWGEIAEIVTKLKSHSADFAVLQCTSKYPTPLNEVLVETMERVAAEMSVPVGLSDHSGKVAPSIHALSRGASVIEVHVTPHKGLRGFDSSSSLDFAQLKSIVAFRDDLVEMQSQVLDKDGLSEALLELRSVFGRSAAPSSPIPQGAKIREDMITFKKPGGGISPDQIATIIGRTAKHDLSPMRIITQADLE